MNIVELYEIYKQYPSIQTDTRKLKKNDLYFALRGPNFNANAFAQSALDSGAAYAVIDDAKFNTHANMILVDDALATLQQLALYHRNQFTIPFIAITGSNGKTTTKELIHAVLSTSYTTYTTYGNLNNHIGVPLTILGIRSDAGMAVIEMGANHQREIASYCLYTRPTHGLITNVGKAHLEGFGGYEGVKKGKGELYDYLRSSDGSAFVMWDYDYLQEMSKGITEVVRYGSFNSSIVASEPLLKIEIDNQIIATQLVGAYNCPNVLAAAAIGAHFEVPFDKIKSALEAYSPSNSRSQLIEQGSNKIVLDAYNANPSSMRAAIENFEKINAENKILILGAMAELGEESLYEHEEIVKLLGRHNWKQVILVGGDFLNINTPYKTFDNSLTAKEWYKSQHFENAYLLVKGSRSMQMERVLEN